MKQWLFGAASLLLALAGVAHGQELKSVAPAPTSGPVYLSDDGLPVGAPATSERPLRRFFNRIGVYCYHDRDAFGCESFHSTMQFIFGSCRTFFREPCDPKPSWAERNGILGRASGCTSCGDW
ncbi:MAG: hypothetical protein U0793_02050 [Gemmataceae bacterium]